MPPVSPPGRPPRHARCAVPPALRHRILLNFEGEAEEILTDEIVEEVLENVKVAAA